MKDVVLDRVMTNIGDRLRVHGYSSAGGYGIYIKKICADINGVVLVPAAIRGNIILSWCVGIEYAPATEMLDQFNLAERTINDPPPLVVQANDWDLLPWWIKRCGIVEWEIYRTYRMLELDRMNDVNYHLGRLLHGSLSDETKERELKRTNDIAINDLIKTLQRYGLPFIERNANDKAILKYMLKQNRKIRHENNYVYPIVMMLFGEETRGRKYLDYRLRQIAKQNDLAAIRYRQFAGSLMKC